MNCPLGPIWEKLQRASRLWLFLDYDGTLADFAPTPDDILPDPEVIALLSRLAGHPRLRVAVISGRRLQHVQKLVPVPGILLAGTYGVELQAATGERIERLDYQSVRPPLEALKRQWQGLIAGREGFYLEDKGGALALHARFATDAVAETVLATAREAAATVIETGLFRLLGGHKFLEVGPRLAHKGQTVGYLLDNSDWPDALPVYLGDDDKDEEAFAATHARGGIAIVIAATPRPTQADCRLESPQEAHRWLNLLLQELDRPDTDLART
jgi:trehalose 6-phosphate phosphatase